MSDGDTERAPYHVGDTERAPYHVGDTERAPYHVGVTAVPYTVDREDGRDPVDRA